MKVLRIVVISVLMLLIACACERLESSQVEMGFFSEPGKSIMVLIIT